MIKYMYWWRATVVKNLVKSGWAIVEEGWSWMKTKKLKNSSDNEWVWMTYSLMCMQEELVHVWLNDYSCALLMIMIASLVYSDAGGVCEVNSWLFFVLLFIYFEATLTNTVHLGAQEVCVVRHRSIVTVCVYYCRSESRESYTHLTFTTILTDAQISFNKLHA